MSLTPPRRHRPSLVDGPVDAALWLLAAGLLGVLIVLSLMSKPPQPVGQSDLILHAGGYALVAFVLLLAAVWRPGRGDGRLAGWELNIAIGLICLGAILEIVQGLQIFPGRSAELRDGLANAVGMGVGVGAWLGLRRWHTQ